MKRCPRCNCRAEFTNRVVYYGGNTGALALGLGITAAASFLKLSHGAHAGHSVYHNLSENLRKHYKCTNSECGYEWDD
jgi:hypothetical protein